MAIFCFSACVATKKVSENKEKDIVLQVGREANITNEVSPGSNNSMQLVDYLRRIPGLQIDQRGNDVTIMIRGANSISGDNSPLYVVNNQAIGNNYNEAVSAVDVNDIKYVNVIKGSEGQQIYGMRAYNGVIQIITKKK
jgi:outer membrane cobalamin receptor